MRRIAASADARSDARLRILMICPGLKLSFSVGRVALTLCARLNPERFDKFLCLADDHPAMELAIPKGVEIVDIHRRSNDGPWALEPLLVARLARFIRSERIDIVHSHTPCTNMFGSLAALLGGAKAVCTLRGQPAMASTIGLVRRLWPLLTARYATVMPEPLDVLRIAEALKVGPHRIERILNGIDLTRFDGSSRGREETRQALGICREHVLVAHVGTMRSFKNHEMLLRGLCAASRHVSDLRLLLVGDGPLSDDLRTLADDLGISARTIFAGVREDIPELLAASDMFCFPSVSEGHRLALLEAMASGLPAIGTDVPGIRFLIAHGETGILVPSGDHRALGKRIVQLAEDRELRARMGEAARVRAREFSDVAMAEHYADLYERVAGRAKDK